MNSLKLVDTTIHIIKTTQALQLQTIVNLDSERNKLLGVTSHVT